jgi:hypothetical protein
MFKEESTIFKAKSSLKSNDHPKTYMTEFLGEEGIQMYQSLIGLMLYQSLIGLMHAVGHQHWSL